MGIKSLFQEKGLISGKRTLAAILVLTMTIGTTLFVSASSHTYKSTGNVEYQDSTGTKTTLFAVEDIDYLDSKIDTLENNVVVGKGNVAVALSNLGTNATLDSSLTFDELVTAINNSQKIPDVAIGEKVDASVTDETYELASSVTGNTVDASTGISAATAENLSLGSAAWVDGELIVGNGGDNNNYYNKKSSSLSFKIDVLKNNFELSNVCGFKHLKAEYYFNIQIFSKTWDPKDERANPNIIFYDADNNIIDRIYIQDNLVEGWSAYSGSYTMESDIPHNCTRILLVASYWASCKEPFPDRYTSLNLSLT